MGTGRQRWQIRSQAAISLMVALTLSCGPLLVHAETGDVWSGVSKIQVTLDHMIGRARQASLMAQLAETQMAIATAEADQIAGNLRPHLTLEGSATKLEQTQYIEPYCFSFEWGGQVYEGCVPRETVDIEVDARSATATLSLRTALWNSPLVQATKDLSALTTERAQSEYDVTMQELTRQVVDLYYGVLEAEVGVGLIELALEEARLALAEIEWQLASGSATPVEHLQAMAKVLELEGQLATARGGVHSGRIALNQLTGYPLDAELILVRPVLVTTLPDLDQALASASRRPDIQKAQTLLAQAEANAVLVRAQEGPSVQLFGRVQSKDLEYVLGVDRHGFAQLSVTGTHRFDAEEKDELSNLFQQPAEGWAVGVNASWSPIDGGTREAKFREADAQVQAAALGVDLLLSSLESQLRQAEAEARGALGSLEAAQRAAEALAEAEARVEEMFRMGAVTERTLLQARLGSLQAEQKLLAAEHEYAKKRLIYLQTAGLQ